MRTWTLGARVASVSRESELLTIAFADEASGPEQYLLLQREFSLSEQDLTLKQDTYYVELSGQDTSFYGGISECMLSNDRLKLGIVPGNKHTALQEVVILRDVDASVWEVLEGGLHDLFNGTNVKVNVME